VAAARILILALVCSLSDVALADVWWVRPGGNNSSSGADSANAFATIAKGIDVAEPGDHIWVCGGTYNESVQITTTATATGIVLSARPGASVIVTGGAAGLADGRTLYLSSDADYWTIRGISFRDNRYNNSTEKYYWVQVAGDHVTMVDCDARAEGDIVAIYPSRLNRLLNWSGTYGLLDSSEFRGGSEGVVVSGAAPRNFTMKNTSIKATYWNNFIMVGDGAVEGTDHGSWVYRCVFDTSYGEDNFQAQENYLHTDWLINQGILFQYCTFMNAKENCLDLKATNATVTVEYSIMVNSAGNNVFPGEPVTVTSDEGGAGVMKGAYSRDRYCIIRWSIIGGNHGGMYQFVGWHAYGLIFYNNSHSWRGYNSTASTYWGMQTDNELEQGERKAFINNIVYDESGASNRAHLKIIKAYAGNIEFDHNLYYQTGGSARFLTNYPGPWNDPTAYIGLTAWQTALETYSAFAQWVGRDAHSIEADPLFADVPANPGAYDKNWDFTLQAGSPAIGAGRAASFAVGGGTNSTTLIVQDPYYFRDSYGITGVAGDSIKIGSGNPVEIDDINYDFSQITLSAQRSWNSGDSVWHVVNGQAVKNIGPVWASQAAPPPPPDPEAVDTVTVSWNKVMHSLTITQDTHLEMADIRGRDIHVFIRNNGHAVTWDDTLTWLTSVPPLRPGALSWYTISRGGGDTITAAMTGPVSGELSPAEWGSLLGDPPDSPSLVEYLTTLLGGKVDTAQVAELDTTGLGNGTGIQIRYIGGKFVIRPDSLLRIDTTGIGNGEGKKLTVVNGVVVVRNDSVGTGGGAGDIEGVTAGVGLSGGGTSGSVTMNMDTTLAWQMTQHKILQMLAGYVPASGGTFTGGINGTWVNMSEWVGATGIFTGTLNSYGDMKVWNNAGTEYLLWNQRNTGSTEVMWDVTRINTISFTSGAQIHGSGYDNGGGYVQVANYYQRANKYLLNIAQNGWLDLIVRNTGGAEAVADLKNIGTINGASPSRIDSAYVVGVLAAGTSWLAPANTDSLSPPIPFDKTFVVDSIKVWLTGAATDTVTFDIRYGPDPSVSGYGTGMQTTPTPIAGGNTWRCAVPNNATIPAGQSVFVFAKKKIGTPKRATVILKGRWISG